MADNLKETDPQLYALGFKMGVENAEKGMSTPLGLGEALLVREDMYPAVIDGFNARIAAGDIKKED